MGGCVHVWSVELHASIEVEETSPGSMKKRGGGIMPTRKKTKNKNVYHDL